MTVLAPHDAGSFAPLAIGSVLAVMVFAGGHVSGAHYNPAVSLAIFLRGKLSNADLIKYWIAQLAGALVAACLTIYYKDSYAEPMAFNFIPAFIAEFLFTFALCFVVLNVATSNKTTGNSYFGWAIGFTVLVGAYAVGNISGGAFNPAVALGITLMKMNLWMNLWIYFSAQLLAAAAAAYVFKAAHPQE
jgi:aquaporin Z